MVETETRTEIATIETEGEIDLLIMEDVKTIGVSHKEKILKRGETEIILTQDIVIADAIETANGLQEVDQGPSVDLTLIDPEVDNLGMKRNKEVGQAQETREEPKTGVDLDLVLMIGLVDLEVTLNSRIEGIVVNHR